MYNVPGNTILYLYYCNTIYYIYCKTFKHVLLNEVNPTRTISSYMKTISNNTSKK